MASAFGLSDPALRRIVIGFGAGFIAVLTFHQLAILMFKLSGVLPQAVPWAVDAYGPFRVPRILNLAFWGGIWGLVFALLADRFPKEGIALVIAGFVFGLLGPALFGWFVMAPIRGQAVAAGWVPAALARGIVINGMFGVGVAVFHRMIGRWFSARTA